MRILDIDMDFFQSEIHNNDTDSNSHLENERLFMVEPTFIQRWNYIEGKPIIEQIYIHQKECIEKDYQ